MECSCVSSFLLLYFCVFPDKHDTLSLMMVIHEPFDFFLLAVQNPNPPHTHLSHISTSLTTRPGLPASVRVEVFPVLQLKSPMVIN